MARRRFFVERVEGARAVMEGEEARHLARVLRAEPGQRYEISDNRAVYLAEIEAVRRDAVSFRAIEELPLELPPVEVTLAAALIKFDRYEWMIEKATELGVARIVPFAAGRTDKGLREAAEKRVERWRKIARESSQQARRARLPEVLPPASLERAVDSAAAYRYVLEEQAGGPPLLSALPARRDARDTAGLLVGPEGGWTDAERGRAADAGWTAVSLGPQILRAETAALAGLAVLMNAWML
jgi:16S rRNA (uracil1498-N3)-methyltransferase